MGDEKGGGDSERDGGRWMWRGCGGEWGVGWTPQRGRIPAQGCTHQHAVVPVLVQQQHACLEAHGDLLLGGAPVVRVEDCLAADAGGG
jgi:hypothetical protein